MITIEAIRHKVERGHYLIRSHVLHHAIKEGFSRQDIVNALTTGQIIETYPHDRRVLVCGYTTFPKSVKIYLHVICEHADPVYLELITAYIPDETLWEKPEFQRRKRRRR